jgi:acyl carrier protein
MTRDEIYTQIVALLEQLFEVDPATVTPESLLVDDLDLDSIDAVDMIVHLQKKTGKRIKPEEFQSVKKVSDVVDVLERLLADNDGKAAQ